MSWCDTSETRVRASSRHDTRALAQDRGFARARVADGAPVDPPKLGSMQHSALQSPATGACQGRACNAHEHIARCAATAPASVCRKCEPRTSPVCRGTRRLKASPDEGNRHQSIQGAATAIVPSGPRDRRHCEATVRARGAGEPAFERCARRAGKLARTGPHYASPGVGPMGAGQPADAGPTWRARAATNLLGGALVAPLARGLTVPGLLF